MTFGLGLLRLPPAHFWQLTLPELAAALRAHAAPATAPPARATLAALMRTYPDGER
jgi:uncharacterized phage protein (TIGR02216 family)